MSGEQEGAYESGPPITVLVVVGLVFGIGHLASLFPDRSALDWLSTAAFTSLIFFYATFTKPGRTSGVGPFIVGVFAVIPSWFAWLLLAANLGSDWYISTFSELRVGLSSRGFGHAGEAFLILWLASLFVMTGTALAARRLVETNLARRL